MLVFFNLLFLGIAFPLLESGPIIIGESKPGIPCEKNHIHEIKFMNVYKTYIPQVIFNLQNYTHETLLTDFSVGLHIEIKSINYQSFTFELSCIKAKAMYIWYAFGGDTYDSGCFPLQERASVMLESEYLQDMEHAVFLAGFEGLFKFAANRPAVTIFSNYANQTMQIEVQSNFETVYVCYILAQDMSTATLNESEVATLLNKYLDDSLIIGLEQLAMFSNSFSFQLLNDKNFMPKQVELRIKVVKLFEPVYRQCPRVYTQCLFEGDPIYVCEDEVAMTSIWKEFKSLRLFDQKIKFKMNIATKDNILWLSDDIECSYDMYDQLMELKIKNDPLQKEFLKKRKLLNMLYENEDEEDDNILTGQEY